MNRYLISLFLLTSALALMSCAKPATKPTELVKEAEIKSKPLKTPPRVEKLGKTSGMGIQELYPLQQSGDVLIYDVRVPYFYAIDHIPGAINWPYNQYQEQVQMRDIEIQKAQAEGKKVVLYCFSLTCAEARNVAKKLSRRDYEIYVLTMGMDSWREAGLPVEKVSQ